jgi:hypothetical protein
MTWTGFSWLKIQVQCAVCSCGICERFPASRISRVVKWSSSRTYSIDTQNRFCVLWNRHSGSAAINRCISRGLSPSKMVCCMFWNRHSGSAVKRWVQAVSICLSDPCVSCFHWNAVGQEVHHTHYVIGAVEFWWSSESKASHTKKKIVWNKCSFWFC